VTRHPSGLPHPLAVLALAAVFLALFYVLAFLPVVLFTPAGGN
jgi:hypothetical protein